ncbi:MAG TPA: glycoside hydrolase family 32 protein [Symbiobacteriaceae bacterium]|nr:glycoside hydrolase family 32 protein [Symbiobacteriaceae bacterium]
MFKQVDAVHLRPTDRAAGAWFGDPVPFYWDGVYHLFYVWDQGHLVLPRVCHSWGHFVSRDLVAWEEAPMAIEPEPEASCGTGSVFHKDGVFHLYYLGRYFTPNGVMYETMCHATSRDLIHWVKDADNPFSRPDLTRYAISDWRDGFPIWNEAAGEYWMLVTASLPGGPAGRRGCLALLTSPDLRRWEAKAPFWAPCLTRHIECPDLFAWNGWWYLIWSGHRTPEGGTFYRRSRSITGPWETPPVDTFDGSAFYAAKTAGAGGRRFLFGWTGTRKGDTDAGVMQWGGHGLVREIWQDADGYLWPRCVPERLALGSPLPAPVWTPQLGQWSGAAGGHGADLAVAHRWGLAYATAPAPRNCLLRCRFTPVGPTQRFGLYLRTDEQLCAGYQVTVEPGRNRVSLTGFGPQDTSPVQPMIRPLTCTPGQSHELAVFVSGTITEVFVDGRVALANRLYDHRGPTIGLFVEEGAGIFSEICLRELPAETW